MASEAEEVVVKPHLVTVRGARSFSLAQCDWLGFDLDHTLVRYHMPNLDRLVIRAVAKFLVGFHSNAYPTTLVALIEENQQFCADFVFKGVVADKLHGHILKLDSHRSVTRAYHGTTELSQEAIDELYGSTPVEFEGVSNDRYFPFATNFERALGPFFALLVVEWDAGRISHENVPDYTTIVGDLLKGIYFNYAAFSRESHFFTELCSNLPEYIFQRVELREWLAKLRQSGIKLFLLTNSYPGFTKILCNYAFGPDWEQLFDMNLFYGRKPRFWTTRDDFHEVRFEGNTEQYTTLPEPAKLEAGKFFQNGNVVDLVEYLVSNRPESRRDLPADTLEVCYFGDHLISDIFMPRNVRQWHTVAIVEEMEYYHIGDSNRTPLEHGHELLHDYNKYWGSFFHTHTGKSTYWQSIIKNFATLCVPCISHFVQYEPEHVFECKPEHIQYPCVLLQQRIPSYTIYYSPPTQR